MGQVSERKLEETKDIIEDINRYIVSLMKKAEEKHKGKRFNFIKTSSTYGKADLLFHGFESEEFMKIRYQFFLNIPIAADINRIAQGYPFTYRLDIDATVEDMVYHPDEVYAIKEYDQKAMDSISLRPINNFYIRKGLCETLIRNSKEVEDYYNDINDILEQAKEYMKDYKNKVCLNIFSTYKNISVYSKDMKGKPEQYKEYFLDAYVLGLANIEDASSPSTVMKHAKDYGLDASVFSKENVSKHIENKRAKGEDFGPVTFVKYTKKMDEFRASLRKDAQKSNTPVNNSNNVIANKKETYPDGAWYEGGFKNGACHGQGTFCWPNGIKYVGPFVNGLCHGEGILYHPDGTTEKITYNNGNIINRAPNIKKETYPDGAWYEGEFKNGSRHGNGTFCWTNGIKYVGPFVNGLCHGEGILYYTDGTSKKVIYENGAIKSIFPNNIRKDYNDGSWYEGELKNDLQHGQGIYRWSDGAWYQGSFENNQRHGQGTFCWANGDKYVGGWNNGSMHGNGIIYYNNGVKEEVVCNNGNYISRKII